MQKLFFAASTKLDLQRHNFSPRLREIDRNVLRQIDRNALQRLDRNANPRDWENAESSEQSVSRLYTEQWVPIQSMWWLIINQTPELQNVFVLIAECIFLNSQMYFSKFKNVFVRDILWQECWGNTAVGGHMVSSGIWLASTISSALSRPLYYFTMDSAL